MARKLRCAIGLHKWIKGPVSTFRVDTCEHCGQQRKAYYDGWGGEFYVLVKRPPSTKKL